MLKKERHAYIMHEIDIHNKVLSSDLSIQLAVSEDTIRRDLQELDEKGNLTKVHGGALSKSFHFTLKNNTVYSQPEKKIIAQKARELIKDGMLVLLSGGTTIIELVKSLPPELNATFITVSIPTALELLDHPNGEVIFLGNKLLKNAQMAVGAEVVQRLSEIKCDLCFLGTNSIDVELSGDTTAWWNQALALAGLPVPALPGVAQNHTFTAPIKAFTRFYIIIFNTCYHPFRRLFGLNFQVTVK